MSPAAHSTGGSNGNAAVLSLPKALNLVDKTAIVTGSARGIGAAIALELGRRGANVVVNYTSAKSKIPADKIANRIASNGTGAHAIAVQADVVSNEGQQALVAAALQLGSSRSINILIHNAGHGDDCYLSDVTEDFYRIQTDINMKAPIFLTQKVLPHMPRSSRIVLVSSCSARMGVPQQTVYAASKAATEAFARVWATELGQSRGITVNCVNPGPVATDMYYASSQEFLDELKPLVDSTPAEGRVGEVDDIAPIVGFLCSEESRWITGSTVSANGGLLFH